MDDRNVPHLTLDHKRKPVGQVALEQHSVDVAGVIGYYDGVAIGNVLEAPNLGRNASEYEYGAGGSGGQFVAQWRRGHKQCRQECEKDAHNENQPRIEAIHCAVQICDVGHFMLMPYGICDSDHAGYRTS